MNQAYHEALARGDMVAAGAAIMAAVSGDYSSEAVHGLHAVARLTHAEKQAGPATDDTEQVSNVQVNNYFGRWRKKS